MSEEGSWGKWFARVVLGALVAAVIGVAVNSALTRSTPSSDAGAEQPTQAEEQTTPRTEPGNARTTSASASVAPETEGCVLTIDHIGASIRDRPAHDARELRAVPSGPYQPISTEIANWAGREELWFLIEVEGTQGWIVDNTILIPSKSADCP